MKTFITIILAITFLMTTGCAVAGQPKPADQPEAGKTVVQKIDERIAEIDKAIALTAEKVAAMPIWDERQKAIDALIKKDKGILEIDKKIAASPEWRQLQYLKKQKADYEALK